jgi:hypothetical protein
MSGELEKFKNFDEIEDQIKSMQIHKAVLLDKFMKSDNVDDILKAEKYIRSMDTNKQNDYNVFFFAPNEEYTQGNAFKTPVTGLSFDVMRKMGSMPIIQSVIGTRIEQIENYLNFQLDDQKEGWTIRKKLGRFEKASGEYENTDEDKRNIEAIADFLENGGIKNKFDHGDDFEDYIRKWFRDSLELDQACVEYERTKGNKLLSYNTVDSSTIRYLNTIDPNKRKEYSYDEINGYVPIYAQVWYNEILTNPTSGEPIIFYPWEMSLTKRNVSTDIRRNNYGRSELEVLLEILTWLLWGMQYNGNFFKQGSNPKGFFTVEGNINQGSMNELRSGFRNMMMGIQNAHKIPVLQGSKDSKISWQDMQMKNKDMEFQSFNEFLMLITCSVYRIDPSELGFNFKQQSQMFGQQGQKERLDHSKDKGLKPLLKKKAKVINKFIVSEMNPKYEFAWTGIDLEDESEMLENDTKKIDKGFVSMEDMFEKYTKRKFDPKKDTILNAVYWQAQQAKQFGGEESNQAVDDMTGEPGEGVQNPFEQEGIEKALSDNPIMAETLKYLETL